MSYAPQSLLDARAYLQPRTGLPWVALGIVGDAVHRGGYHCGRDRLVPDDYSNRTARDRAGLTDAAAALDVGWFARLVELTTHLVGEARAGRLLDVRELIGPWSDRRAYRWDHQAGWSPVRRAEGDSHETHLHISYYRDSERREKITPFRVFFEGRDWLGMATLDQLKTAIREVLGETPSIGGLAGDTLPEGWQGSRDRLLAYAAMTPSPVSRGRIAASNWTRINPSSGLEYGTLLRHLHTGDAPWVAQMRELLAAVLAGVDGLDTAAVLARVDAHHVEVTARLVEAETARDRAEAALAGLPETLAPAVLAGLREQLGEVADERLVAAAEAGVRAALGGLDEGTPI